MKMKDTNEKQPEETDQQSYTDSQPETETDATTAKLPEYFSMKLLPLIHEVYAGENYQMQRKIYFEEHRRRFETKNDTSKLANQVKIHFPPSVSDSPDAYEEIRISANDGERTAYTTICLSRIFKDNGQPDPEPEALPEEAKFKMIIAEFTPLMHIESLLPSPLDLITFRITDINGHYMPTVFPKFTNYYDSIVWSADHFPHTFKIYEHNVTAEGEEKILSKQWSSHFFKSGTVKSRLKGYRHGKVEYETSLNTTLYNRDFLGLEWGTIVLQNPQNLTAYCLLDRDFEYQVYDIVAKNDVPYSQIIPVNHKSLSDADFPPTTEKAIKTLMENNFGKGQDAKEKENLFKCLPEKGVKAELYWENPTTHMLMLHQLSDGTDELVQERYYLHVEPK